MKINQILTFTCATALTLTSTLPLLAEGRGAGGHSRPSPARRAPAKHPQPSPQNRPQYPRQDSREVQQQHSGGDGSAPRWHQTRDPGVNQRQDNQHDRINQGVRSGQLTKDETKELASTQKEIRQEEKEYKSDGTLTIDERKDLHQDLNAASKEIYQEKHDAETRPGVEPAKPGTPGTRDPGVNNRQDNQHDRIVGGIKSGSLTKDETKELASTQKEIRQEEKEYKSDGTLTIDERKDLHQDLNAASKEIYQEKHDEDIRTPHPDPKNLGSKESVMRSEKGTPSGGSPRWEALSPKEKEARIARMKQRLQEDGKLSVEERSRIKRMLEHMNREGSNQKHEIQKR